MRINEIWQREITEEEEKFRRYQQDIERAEKEIQELTEDSAFYAEVYQMLTSGMEYAAMDCRQSGLLRSKEERIAACQNEIKENQKHLEGQTTRETELFHALAKVDVTEVKRLADGGMTRAMFYYACHEAVNGNLQISRFKECLDAKERPYDAKAEMVLLVYEAEEMERQFQSLKSEVEASIQGTTDMAYEEQKTALKNQKDYSKRLDTMEKDMVKVSEKIREFVKERLVTARSSWNDSAFLEMCGSLEGQGGMSTLKSRLKRSISDLEERRSREWNRQNRWFGVLKKLVIPVALIGIVFGLEAWFSNAYEGARLYIELDGNPKMIFQYETEEEKNKADIPEKFLFFETEVTTTKIFQNRGSVEE